MVITQPLVEAVLIKRYARFLMDLRLPDGSVVTAHCPNSGSMEGCLLEGAPVLATEAANPLRRLKYTAEYVRLPSGWVGINTHRTNLVVGRGPPGGGRSRAAGLHGGESGGALRPP